MNTIKINGDQINSIADFITEFCRQQPGLDRNEIQDLPTLSRLITDKGQPLEIVWHNSARSRTVMVRHSDIPLIKQLCGPI